MAMAMIPAMMAYTYAQMDASKFEVLAPYIHTQLHML